MRHLEVSEYLGDGAQLQIGTDASPHGIGGWLAMNGVILHYFQDRITPEDIKLYIHRAGHYEGQQTWECLALLVAARLWEAAFQN